MGKARTPPHPPSASVRTTNRKGRSPVVLVCDHASNSIPDQFGPLDLDRSVESRVSRLVMACIQPLDAPDLSPAVSKTTAIPGNARLAPAERMEHIAFAYDPFHAEIDGVISGTAAGVETRLVSIHSFTPVYKRVARPWHIGVIHDDDFRLASPLIAALRSLTGVTVKVRAPYPPADRVYFTLERHARSLRLACPMIENRNDEFLATAEQRKWTDLLTYTFAGIHTPEASMSRESLARRPSNPIIR